jgi:adenine/guanine phosphoribosyltransferase-like PRPP-binding protein
MTDAEPTDPWTLPTTGFWQQTEPASAWAGRMQPPYRHGYPAALGNGQVLVLPVRRLPGGQGHAVASFIANQAALPVVSALGRRMAALAQAFAADVVVGLPTLGMVFAPLVAAVLGHTRWVPMGTSRKFWYDEALSVAAESITTPSGGKRLYLDPNQLALVQQRRVLIVDDAVSSGRTLQRVWPLLEALGAEVAGAVVAMRQGSLWRDALGPEKSERVVGVFDCPLLALRADGWWPR